MIFNLVWLPARQTGSSTRTKVLLRIMLRDTTVCEDDLVKQALRRFEKEGVRCAHRLPNHKEKDKEKAMTSATRTPKVQTVNMKLQVVVIPVSDVDRAK